MIHGLCIHSVPLSNENGGTISGVCCPSECHIKIFVGFFLDRSQTKYLFIGHSVADGCCDGLSQISCVFSLANAVVSYDTRLFVWKFPVSMFRITGHRKLPRGLFIWRLNQRITIHESHYCHRFDNVFPQISNVQSQHSKWSSYGLWYC